MVRPFALWMEWQENTAPGNAGTNQKLMRPVA